MNTITALFLIIALGYALGRITVKGVNLGASGIILVALVFGHFGYAIPKEIQNLGLMCFVTAVGYIAGPVFFRNFKQKAFAYIGIGFLVVTSGALLCAAAIALLDIPAALATGLMCGALTSTPGLAAALEASGDAIASVGYGIAYPFGVIGVVRGIYARREEAEREQRRTEHASRRVGRTQHPISLPQRHSLPPDYRQHLIDAGIIKPAGDPT